jgi:tetratricopeptide (TPR) repeat protein
VERRVIPWLGDRFGIHSPDALRNAIQRVEPSEGNVSHAWLLSWLKDFPGELEVHQRILEQQPDNLDALMSVAALQMTLNQWEEAWATLQKGHDGMRDWETRDGTGNIGHIYSGRCWVLLREGKYEEARQACETAIERGSLGQGNLRLAKVWIALGDYEKAQKHIQAALRSKTLTHGHPHYALGIALAGLGRLKEARGAWGQSLKLDPEFGAPVLALMGQKLEPLALLKAEQRFDRLSTARTLARCGHFYLELELPERAARCFEAADRLQPAISDVQRLAHQAETDPQGALLAAESLRNQHHHPDLFALMATIHLEAGRPLEALRWSNFALDLDPANVQAHQLKLDSCLAAGQPNCSSFLPLKPSRPVPAPASTP